MAALAVLAVAAYGNSLHGGFVLDNDPLILQDPRVQHATWDNVRLIFEHTYWWPLAEHGLYRPLTKLSFLFNYAVLGEANEPAGYHVVNLALHVVNGLLAFAISARLFSRASLAFAAAALWAVHPIGTEAVTNIVGRADLLAATGVLGGFLLYLQALERRGWPRALTLIGLAAATAIGVLSKESAIALPAVVVLHAAIWRPGRESRPTLAAAAVAMAVPVAWMLWQRGGVLAQATAAEFHYVDNPIVGAGFFAGRLTALAVVARYLGLIAWPATLSSDYSFDQIPVATGRLDEWIAWAVVASVAALLVWLSRRNRLYAFFGGFALVTFAPVSNLIFTTGTIMAERLAYLPAVGVAACVALAAGESAERWRARRASAIVLVALVAALGARTWMRNRDWQTDLSLWTSAVHAAPQSFETHRGLAAALYAADPTHANLTAVIAEMDRSVAIVDPLPDALNATDVYADAGWYAQQRGDQIAAASGADSQAARGAYERSAALLTRGAAIDRAVGDAYVRAEVARGRSAGSIAPVGLPALYERLALTDVRLGRTDAAIEAARQARRLEPMLPTSHNALAWVLVNTGHRDEAVVALLTSFLMTSDPRAIPALQSLYASGLDPQRCAFTTDAAGTALNPQCPAVRDNLCKASNEVAAIYRWNRRDDLAAQTDARAANTWGCPAAGR